MTCDSTEKAKERCFPFPKQFLTNDCFTNLPLSSILEALDNHKLSATAYELGKKHLHEALQHELRLRHKLNCAKVSSVHDFVSDLITCYEKENKRFVLIEGVAFCQIAYGKMFARDIEDVDILIDREDSTALHQVEPPRLYRRLQI